MPAQEPAAPAQPQTERRPEFDWNEIEKPGSYLVKETGNLVRVPQEGLSPGHSPLISLTCCEPDGTRVVKLSENPSAPISKLRRIAADSDHFVNF